MLHSKLNSDAKKAFSRAQIRNQDLRDILAFADSIECSSIANESHLYDDIHVIEDIDRKRERE